MENNSQEKKAKSSKQSAHGSIRVRKETRKRVLAEMAKINKKDFGRKVHVDTYISLAMGLVSPEHVKTLQESSLSKC